MTQFDLADKFARSGQFDIEVQGGRIPVKFNHAGPQARAVIFSFHGAIDRKTRPIPSYPSSLPHFDGLAHQICVSDPSMLIGNSFNMSWYAGHAGFETQNLLKQIFAQIIDTLDTEKVIFMGGSGGGFAALYFSWHFPDSVCIATCPQTSIARYYKGHSNQYLAECWPDVPNIKALSSVICTDLGSLYSQNVPNTVIYLQSAGDYFHFKNHLVPFLNEIDLNAKNGRFILNNGFWGKLSHGGSVPPHAFRPWLQTIVLAPDLKTDTLLQTHYELKAASSSTVTATRPKASAAKFEAAKIERATLIRNWQLSQS
jgi:hypothetical protein